MSGRDDDRAALEARNAALKEQVDGLLDRFHEQTRQLEEAQAAASASTATVTSPDGSVTVTVDSSGTMTNLQFAAKSFQSADPQKLARTVMETVRTATTRVQKQVADLMAPMTEDLPDLSDLIEGAPSLKGLMPKLPDFSEEAKPAPDADVTRDSSERQSTPPHRGRGRQAHADPDDDLPDSWLVGGQDR